MIKRVPGLLLAIPVAIIYFAAVGIEFIIALIMNRQTPDGKR